MLTFNKMTPQIAAETRDEWLKQIERDPSEFVHGRYIRILDWANNLAENSEENLYAYAITSGTNKNHAHAILELSHARPQSDAPWLKVLSIHVEPDLDVSRMPADIQMLADISVLAIKECLRLAFTAHKSETLKVYAEEPISLPFLQWITAPLSKELTISTHNRWLVLSGLEFNNN